MTEGCIFLYKFDYVVIENGELVVLMVTDEFIFKYGIRMLQKVWYVIYCESNQSST